MAAAKLWLMRRFGLAALITGIALQFTPTGSGATPALAAGLTLTPNGIGHLRVGMTVRQARRASGRRIILGYDAFGPSCRYASVRSLRVGLMLSYGRIVRIDLLRNSPVHAMGGIRRGDSERAVFDAFGEKVTRTQHQYVPEGSYLTVGWKSGRFARRGIRFETNGDGTITSIYAGRRAQIRYIEGCA